MTDLTEKQTIEPDICPRCGSEPEIMPIGKHFDIRCTGCFQTPLVYAAKREEIIKTWNNDAFIFTRRNMIQSRNYFTRFPENYTDEALYEDTQEEKPVFDHLAAALREEVEWGL